MAKVLLQLQLQEHKEAERIFARYPFNPDINKIIKEIPGARYSNTNKCWHLPVDKKLLVLLAEKIKGIAEIDTKLLKQQLTANKSNAAIKSRLINKSPVTSLSQVNQDAYEKYVQTLILQKKAASTIKTYRNEFQQYLRELKDVPADSVSLDRIKNYFVYCFQTLQLSSSIIYSRINALKFYYEQVLGRENLFIELPRPKRPLILPKVLGENELTRLFNALPNLKHKAILFTAYSAGLRVSEVTALQLNHVDSDRMQLYIKCAKGEKDRYVGLSPVVLDILRSYITNCKVRPVNMCLRNWNQGKHIQPVQHKRYLRMQKIKPG